MKIIFEILFEFVIRNLSLSSKFKTEVSRRLTKNF